MGMGMGMPGSDFDAFTSSSFPTAQNAFSGQNTMSTQMQMQSQGGEQGDMLEGMSLEELTRIINDSGMDQAGWDELFGLVSQAGPGMDGLAGQADMQGQAGQGQGQGQMAGVPVGGEEVMGQFGGDDWGFLNV